MKSKPEIIALLKTGSFCVALTGEHTFLTLKLSCAIKASKLERLICAYAQAGTEENLCEIAREILQILFKEATDRYAG